MSVEPTSIDVQAYDWEASDILNVYTIRIWAHNLNGDKVLIRVEDYEPFIRMELPRGWTILEADIYFKWLLKTLGDSRPTKYVFNNLKKLYWYRSGIKVPILTCYFRTEEDLRKCKNLINRREYEILDLGLVKPKIWENHVPLIHRFITDINVSYGQWLRIKCTPVDVKISNNKYEYIASYKDILPVPQEECKTWVVYPTAIFFDIEVYSSNHNKMPEKYFREDCIIQISVVFQKLNDINSRQKYLLYLGDHELDGKIKDVTTICYKYEMDLVSGFCDLVNKLDPAILVGYNIFGFDIPYMDARLKINLKDWDNCSLLKDFKVGIIEREWKSAAYGIMSITRLNCEGRLCVDLHTIIRRDYKLDMYNLDFVSKHFLKVGKHDVKAKTIFKYYQEFKEAKRNNQLTEEHINNMIRVGEYCIQDSCLCADLMMKLNTWIMLVEMSSIVQVPIITIFTGGQQKRVLNQLYQYAYREGFVLDEYNGSMDTFKGANVYDPIPGLHKNIIIFDFASLYPSIIRAYNICYTTILPEDSNIPDHMCNVLQWEEVDEEGNKKQYKYRYIKHEYYTGILPRICEYLVNARKETRKKISPENDDIYNMILDQRQNGLKISANSIFGALGVKSGKIPLLEGARSITAKGRELQMIAGEYVKEKYNAKIIAGDSVVGETPILIKQNGEIKWIYIKDLVEVKNTFDKVYIDIKDTEVWSDIGWTKIKRLIYHKTNKKIYRVITNTGLVDATEDHSLLDENKNVIKPEDVKIKSKLCHNDLPILEDQNISLEEAWRLGFSFSNKLIKFPQKILSCSREIKLQFLKGYKSMLIDKYNDALDTACLVHLYNSLGFQMEIVDNKDKFIIEKINKEYNYVKRIVNISYNGYVFDLETENHHFSAGIGRLVVHNTDSIMVDLGITDPHECVTMGEKLSKEITSLYIRPLNLEFERAMSLAFFIKKKRYAGVPMSIIKLNPEDKVELYKENIDNKNLSLYKVTQKKLDFKTKKYEEEINYIGIPKDIKLNNKFIAGTPMTETGFLDVKKIAKKGVMLARRDNCAWSREFYLKILLNILFEKPIEVTLDICNDEILNLMQLGVDSKKLYVTGTIRDNYKQTSTYPIKLFSDILRNTGYHVEPGERFDYVFVKYGDKKVKQAYKMRLTDMYLANKDTEKLDYIYYIDKYIVKPVEQLICIAYKDIIEENNKYYEEYIKFETALKELNKRIVKNKYAPYKDYKIVETKNGYQLYVGYVQMGEYKWVPTYLEDKSKTDLYNKLYTEMGLESYRRKKDIYTQNLSKYIQTWVLLLRCKEEYINDIKMKKHKLLVK